MPDEAPGPAPVLSWAALYLIVAVALANKNARIVWSLLAHDTAYDQRLTVSSA